MSTRNIKIRFIGKAPAGFDAGLVDFCSEYELKQWEASGEYDIEVFDAAGKKVEAPKKTNKPKKKKK